MDENPYRSPLTPGAEYDRPGQRGIPYTWWGILYLTCSLPLSLIIPFSVATMMPPDFGLMVMAVGTPTIFSSGLYVLWKSWRPPPER